MESEYTSFEESLFLNLSATRDSTVALANYTQDVATQEDKSARLNGNIATRRVGPAKLIAVSPGDTVDMEVFAYFQTGYSNSGDVGQSNLVTAVASAFGGSASAAIGSEARSVYELFNANAALTFVGSSGNSSLPKAYLNYILFDQDFNDIAHDYIQIGDTTNTHQQLNLSQSINQGGYIYVWLSNESQTDFNVYFDDLRVTHTKGAILQEDHYYPFGANISALSSTAPLSKPNKYKYNGFEEQTDFNLGWYDYQARFYDPQLGRFMQVDPAADLMTRYTPYAYAFNNPMRFIDPDGMMPTDTVKNNQPTKPEEITKAAENGAEYTTKLDEKHGSTARCNQGVCRAFTELTGSNELDGKRANAMVATLEGSKNFVQIDVSDSQEAANKGGIIIIGQKDEGTTEDEDGNVVQNSGHVVMAVPGKEGTSPSLGGEIPTVMDTGPGEKMASQSMRWSFRSSKGLKAFLYIGGTFEGGSAGSVTVTAERQQVAKRALNRPNTSLPKAKPKPLL